MIKLFQVTFVLLSASLFSQENKFPKDYFGLPLEIPVNLSATFGELRTNHFHSGIDLKTQEKEGFNVLAAADGFVSRIKISKYGYGKALYVTHPNGYTTVYGHLKEFSPKIEALVKKKQYEQKTFEIELFPKAIDLSVSKGEKIALSGNTGGSGGPHLHFEYRDTKTEHIINPFCFGIDKEVSDTKAPLVLKLVGYPLESNAVVNQSQLPITITLKEKGDGGYIAQPIEAKGKIGFGIDVYDLSNENWNRKGAYQVQTVLNGDPSFEYKFDTFSFDETRYINAFIDYSRFIKDKDRVQKLFIDNANKLSILKPIKNNGVLEIKPNLDYLYTIQIKDFHGNATTILVPIKYTDAPVLITKPINTTKTYHIKSTIDNSLSQDGVSIFMPANCFYGDFDMNFSVTKGEATVHNSEVAVHKNITITFDISHLGEKDRKGLFIASLEGSKWEFNTSKIKKNTISTSVKLLGNYKLAYDIVTPVISKMSFENKDVLYPNTKISFKATDDLSGIDSFDAYIDEKWFLLEYDYKTDLFTGDLSDISLLTGEHEFKVIIKDRLGNEASVVTSFVTK